MLPLGIANEFALLSLTRICENGKLWCAYGTAYLILNSNEDFFYWSGLSV